jgi:hypothetical protein
VLLEEQPVKSFKKEPKQSNMISMQHISGWNESIHACT